MLLATICFFVSMISIWACFYGIYFDTRGVNETFVGLIFHPGIAIQYPMALIAIIGPQIAQLVIAYIFFKLGKRLLRKSNTVRT
jgi:hypothetical protein